jgi:peptidoglycan/xylan/chitin deacetylase (PgdA/CDA1 family)
LALLDARGVKATFFVWGEQAAAHNQLMQAALRSGHQIQPHCWSHETSYHHMTREEIGADIDRVLALLAEAGVEAPTLWRPPWGEWRPGDNDILAQERGLKLNGWTIDSSDWSGKSAASMYQHVTEALAGSGTARAHVLLMHDGPCERGQWKMRQNVDETVELLRMLLDNENLSLGPQADPVPDSLNPAWD